VNEPLIIPVPPINLVVSWTNILGIEMSERLLKRNKIIEQYIFDPVILKVILIILVLSSGNCRNIDYIDMNQICDDSLSIFRAQNIYVELLWKYILSRSPGEKHAVKFLNKLMMFLLYAQNLHLHLDYYVHSLKDEIKRMEPIMQSMWPRIDNEEDMNIT
ncbi:unnamed protein product, partial [Rotaria sordida]